MMVTNSDSRSICSRAQDGALAARDRLGREEPAGSFEKESERGRVAILESWQLMRALSLSPGQSESQVNGA